MYKKEKTSPNIKILVACHKADSNIRQDDIYMPIQVGKDLHPELDLGFQCDNSGDNISYKNGNYCELTAIYWAWKNLKNVDYIGFCHYRRYFDYNINIKNLEKDLKKYDVIAIKRKIIPYSSEKALSLLLTREDVAIASSVLLKENKEYYKDILNYFFRNNKLSRYNMFIMNWSTFDSYCADLFSFLEDVEKELKPHNYSRLKRTIGYLAEAFQGLFFLHKKFKIKYVDVHEAHCIRRNKLIYHLRKQRDNFIFSLFSKPKKIKFIDSTNIGLKQDNLYLEEFFNE